MMIKKLFLSTLVIMLLAIVVTVAFFYWDLRRVNLLVDHYPKITYDRKQHTSNVILVKGQPAGWVPINQIAEAALGAVIVSEDWSFYQHHGYDLQQIRESIETNMKEQRYARGASTITQQVVRNVFLDKDKTLYRKGKELMMAVMLERVISKKKILEIYFNIAEWGEGIYGIGAASRQYFQKSPAEVTPKEGAFLAMLLPSPQRYSVSYRRKQLTGFANQTVERILAKMVQAGFINKEAAQHESCSPLNFEAMLESGASVSWRQERCFDLDNPLYLNH